MGSAVDDSRAGKDWRRRGAGGAGGDRAAIGGGSRGAAEGARSRQRAGDRIRVARRSRAVFASVPIGLEDVAIAEAGNARQLVRRGIDRVARRVPRGLRCIYDVRFLIAEGAAGAFAETVKKAQRAWREWITQRVGRPPLSLLAGERARREAGVQRVLRLARETFSPQGLVDSPSSYAAMLRVEADPDATRIWLVPTFEADERFAYRVATSARRSIRWSARVWRGWCGAAIAASSSIRPAAAGRC